MENNNSVAFITKITKLSSIEGADKIEQGTIEGWNSIVQKDIHKEGDLVLCITTDAVIPEELAIKWGVASYLHKGNRVHTVKLRGVYSECILIPLFDIFDENSNNNYLYLKDGDDLMNILGIFKYEPPAVIIHLPGKKQCKQKQNPNFSIYYKFPNQKNVPNMFNEKDLVVVTRKIHGCNARYGIVQKTKITILDKIKKLFGNKFAYYEYVYGSHQVQKINSSKHYYKDDIWKEIDKQYNIESKLWCLLKNNHKNGIDKIDNIIIYGEIYGEGIQGDKYTYGIKGKAFKGFDIIINNEYIGYYNKQATFIDILNLPSVEKLYLDFYNNDLKTLYLNDKMENGYYHEGVVISSIDGSRDKIMKCISPEYLIKAEKEDIPDGH